MWTLTGPFDGEVAGELGFQKTKLLKTGTTYPLGRKGTGLIISSKKISSYHCEFVVGPYSIDDVGDPTKKPTLEFINKKDKGMRIARGEAELPVNPSASRELQDGDVIAIISGVLITVQWTPICCYSQFVRGKSTVPLDSCASLGINIVPTPNIQVTHHLLSSYVATPLVALSLLSACQLVRPEWIHEVIRLGQLPRNHDPAEGSSLEQTFSLPPASKYRPSFSPSLPSSQRAFNVWEPNEERLGMLTGYRFLWVDEKARELDRNIKDIIDRGGGSFETFDVHAGRAKLHRALARGQAKEGKIQVIVGKANSVQASIGKDGWIELVDEAKTFNLHLIDPDVIVQVIVDVDTSLFDATPGSADTDASGAVGSLSLPDFVPNTHPDEPSIPPPGTGEGTGPLRRLTRRATSRQGSQEPSSISRKSESETDIPRPRRALTRQVTPHPSLQDLSLVTKSPELGAEVPHPRRALTRRVNAGVPVITGLDDPSSILDSVPTLPPPRSPPQQPSVIFDLTAPTPMRSTKLKRRVGGGVSADTLSMNVFALGVDEVNEEPPLKKFKALFDASHPDHDSTASIGEATMDGIQSMTLGDFTETQTQSQTQGGRSRPRRSGATVNLSILREEEEETQPGVGSPAHHRGTKRTLEDVSEAPNDVNIAEPDTGSGPERHLSKKRAVENINQVKNSKESSKPALAGSKPPSAAVAKIGALPGQPDKDAAFLKAIASTKRGKKLEDEFDRDFNKLKISKPDLVREEPEKQWTILEDFGDETNVRGNFMVVVEIEVPNRRQQRLHNDAPQWQGKPNFKKFKKKDTATRKAQVELVVSEENDYGLGPAYWKGANTQAQTQAAGGLPTHEMATAKSQGVVINDSDEEANAVLRRGKGKATSIAGSAAPKRPTSRTTKAPTKSKPLFFDSDDDVDELVDSGDDELTLRSSAGTNTRSKAAASTRPKRPAPILADDDSDDGAVFKGFKGKTRKR